MERVLEIEEEVEATLAGRGGIVCWRVFRVVLGRKEEGLGVTLAGVMPGDRDTNLVFTGDAVRGAAAVPVLARGGFPTGVTNPFEVVEIVRFRAVVVGVDSFCGGGGGGVSFSAFASGTNMPEFDADAVKYRTPATLPSFFP